jgi:hypothetical protein
MSRYLKIAFISLIIILVIVAILLLFLRRQTTPVPSPVNTNTNVNAAPAVGLNVNVPAIPSPPVTDEEKSKTDLARLASAFVERFGSYSNQSDFENITDLEVFMTERMQTWARDFIEKSRAEKPDTSIYWGVTTRALKTEILNFDESLGKTEILVSTQRREAVGTTTNAKVYYQDISLKFAKEGGAWKVDEATWK